MKLFTKRSALLRLLAIAAVGAVIAAGCGDDDEEAAPTTTAQAEPEVTSAPTESAAPEAAPEPEETSPPAEPSAEASATGRCGDPERLGDSINFLNWPDYIDQAVLDIDRRGHAEGSVRRGMRRVGDDGHPSRQ